LLLSQKFFIHNFAIITVVLHT